jgi:5'-nucleotidase
MKILLSNDDGVYAKGLSVLADHLRELSAIIVVAPDRNRSGASNSLTLDAPVRIKTIENGSVSVEGTPTDCVHLALTGLLDELPSMVVSGINEGANLGDDILYSGTVAAAMEGRFLGLSAIAISLAGEHCRHYETAGRVARTLVQHVMIDPLPADTILNVNVPDLPFEELMGYEVTRLGSRHSAEPMIRTKDPRGNEVYWVGPTGPARDDGPGTDFYAVAHKKVSITPLKIDLTHYQAFDQVSSWLEGFTK